MKKFVLIIAVAALGIYLAGCGKKESDQSALQEPTSMEALTAQSTTAPAVETKQVAPVVTPAAPVSSEVKLEQLPPSGPFKPSNLDIQTALKNAGYYTGTVDGKIGPKTKKAIEECQKANSLKADGKVGPKTWEALSKYLSVASKPAKK
ncbi:MAG: peptidoglycan-binding domain-containing protein [Candidatus Omnitrophica bacterium]|nr:peptidoglycan-binding domain-containing protein [Candidatus Omnitrophota bacterium]